MSHTILIIMTLFVVKTCYCGQFDLYEEDQDTSNLIRQAYEIAGITAFAQDQIQSTITRVPTKRGYVPGFIPVASNSEAELHKRGSQAALPLWSLRYHVK